MLPTNQHLKVAITINATLGVWPVITEPKKDKYYKIFSKFALMYFLQFIIKSYMKLYLILTDDIIQAKELFANLATTLLCTIAVVRVYALRTAAMTKIFKAIIEIENQILKFGTKEQIEIYNSFAKQSKVSNIIFLGCLAFGK